MISTSDLPPAFVSPPYAMAELRVRVNRYGNRSTRFSRRFHRALNLARGCIEARDWDLLGRLLADPSRAFSLGPPTRSPPTPPREDGKHDWTDSDLVYYAGTALGCELWGILGAFAQDPRGTLTWVRKNGRLTLLLRLRDEARRPA